MDDDATKPCSKCGEIKLLSEFRLDRKMRLGRKSQCRKCEAEAGRQWRAINPEAHAESNRRWYQADPEARREASRQWREANPGVSRVLCRRWHANLKAQVFAHYGQSCACCGTSENLSIDHINGGGTAHSEEVGGHMYLWLVREGFPEGFQTLCQSCNSSKWKGPACRLSHDTGDSLT